MNKEMTPEEQAEYEALMRQALELQKTFDTMIGNAFGGQQGAEDEEQDSTPPAQASRTTMPMFPFRMAKLERLLLPRRRSLLSPLPAPLWQSRGFNIPIEDADPLEEESLPVCSIPLAPNATRRARARARAHTTAQAPSSCSRTHEPPPLDPSRKLWPTTSARTHPHACVRRARAG